MKDIKAVFLDFGGVIAEEGFKAGIVEIAKQHRLDADQLKKVAFDLVYETGFVTGQAVATDFWDQLKNKSGISEDNDVLTKMVLERFVIRDYMLDIAGLIKSTDRQIFILSDQTHWLDEMNEERPFFQRFDVVFNSYHLGITKKDPAIFDRVLHVADVMPENALFVDDHLAHIERAKAKGMHTIFYTDKTSFIRELSEYIPDINLETH